MEIAYKEPTFLTEKQKKIYYSKARNIIAITSNKVGKSLLGALLMNKNMLLMPSGSNGAWLAPYARQAFIGYEYVCKLIRSTEIYQYLEDINHPHKFKFNSSKLQITYPNGNRVDFFQGQNTQAIFGNKYHFCIVDEATRLKNELIQNGDKTIVTCPAFDALKTTTRTTNARFVILSNPTSRQNFFYRWWEKAKEGKDERTEAFHMDVYDSVEAGFVDIEEVEYAKKHESRFIFKRDWLGLVPDEDNSVFDSNKIYSCVDDELKEDISKVKYFGVDLGFTVKSKSDYTVVVGLDKNCKVRFFKRFKKDSEDLINILKAYINNKKGYIDATGAGLVIYNLLKKHCPNLEPYTFSNSSKCLCIENLAHYIHGEKVSYIYNELLLNELSCYESETTKEGKVTYSNGKGALHDDSVVALGLAVLKYKEETEDGKDNFSYEVYGFEEEESDFERLFNF